MSSGKPDSLNVRWTAHLYRAAMSFRIPGGKPWHTHVFRAWRSFRGDIRYKPNAGKAPSYTAEGNRDYRLIADRARAVFTRATGGVPEISDSAEVMKRIREEVEASNRKRDLASGMLAPPGRRWAWRRTLHFRKGAACLECLTEGWSIPELDRVWSDGREAGLEIPAPLRSRPVRLTLLLEPYLPPGLPAQSVTVRVAGAVVLEFKVPKEGHYDVVVPPAALPFEKIRIGFEFPDCESPARVSGVSDTRELAVALKSLKAVILR